MIETAFTANPETLTRASVLPSPRTHCRQLPMRGVAAIIAGIVIAHTGAARADDPPPAPAEAAENPAPPPSPPDSVNIRVQTVSGDETRNIARPPSPPAPLDAAKVKAQTVQKDAEDRVKEKATEIDTFLNAGDLDGASRAQAEQAAERTK